MTVPVTERIGWEFWKDQRGVPIMRSELLRSDLHAD